MKTTNLNCHVHPEPEYRMQTLLSSIAVSQNLSTGGMFGYLSICEQLMFRKFIHQLFEREGNFSQMT